MILRRLGNKKKIAPLLLPHFPPHKIYIEPFFGAGGMFFSKPKAKYNIVNDLDSDVFNLFQVVMDDREGLEKAFYMMPIHSDLLEYWKENEETEPIKKALRFLFLSNFTLYGKQDTMRYSLRNKDKQAFEKNINKTFKKLQHVSSNNKDFRDFFDCLSFSDVDFGHESNERENTFIYSDSPYLETGSNYSDSEEWNKNDVVDLFDCLVKTECNFAYSEFNHPFILDQAKERDLNVIMIGERQNLKNRRTEILITNYEKQQLSMFND